MLTPVIRTVLDDEYTLASDVFFKISDSPPVSVTVCVGPSSVNRETVWGVFERFTALTAVELPKARESSTVRGESTSL